MSPRRLSCPRAHQDACESSSMSSHVVRLQDHGERRFLLYSRMKLLTAILALASRPMVARPGTGFSGE